MCVRVSVSLCVFVFMDGFACKCSYVCFVVFLCLFCVVCFCVNVVCVSCFCVCAYGVCVCVVLGFVIFVFLSGRYVEFV